ncbi:MAG: ATP phosphoribosyltransferase [Candidatus Bathyarchaeia archaeon]
MKILRVALPKGHLWRAVSGLLDQAGYGLRLRNQRSYYAESNDPELEIRIHRAQNISPLIEEGKYDVGITGLDWVKEHRADVQEIADLGEGRVDIVAAVPQTYDLGSEPGRVLEQFTGAVRKNRKDRIIVASEYENLTRDFCRTKLNALPCRFIRSYGATETFIGVADLIVDCTETGATLRENGWQVMSTLFNSTARLIANKESLKDPWKREKVESFTELTLGARDARGMKLIKMNVAANALGKVLAVLPSMKSPTISKLAGDDKAGYAVEVAVNEKQVVQLLPLLRKQGASDILELDIKKVIK